MEKLSFENLNFLHFFFFLKTQKGLNFLHLNLFLKNLVSKVLMYVFVKS